MYKSDTNDTILHIGSSRNIGFLDCIFAGITESKPEDEKYTRTVSEGYTFGYVLSGKGIIETDNRVCAVSADTFFFIEKGQSVCFRGEESAWERMWLQIDGSLAENLVRTFCLSSVFTADVNVRCQFLEIRDKLTLMKTENGALANKRIACLLFEILTEVRSEAFFSHLGPPPGTAEAIRNYLDSNIYNDISLELLTEEFGISKMHVIRLFKKEYDTTPMQYVMDRRIHLAKSLLAGTVMPIREIAELLKYANSQHFSNAFRTATGLSPNKYRKEKQQKHS